MSTTAPLSYSAANPQPPPFVTLPCTQIQAQEIFTEILKFESLFKPSELANSINSYTDPSRRKSLTLSQHSYVKQVGEIIQSVINQNRHQVLSALSLSDFPQGDVQLSCLSYQNGSFFIRHRDHILHQAAARVYTWVYFFHKEPKAFRGGDLVFFTGDTEIARVIPKNGTLVIFRADTYHQVEEVRIDTGEFSDSRFCLTGFVLKKPTLLEKMQLSLFRKVRVAHIPKPFRNLLRALYRYCSTLWLNKSQLTNKK